MIARDVASRPTNTMGVRRAACDAKFHCGINTGEQWTRGTAIVPIGRLSLARSNSGSGKPAGAKRGLDLHPYNTDLI